MNGDNPLCSFHFDQTSSYSNHASYDARSVDQSLRLHFFGHFAEWYFSESKFRAIWQFNLIFPFEKDVESPEDWGQGGHGRTLQVTVRIADNAGDPCSHQRGGQGLPVHSGEHPHYSEYSERDRIKWSRGFFRGH